MGKIMAKLHVHTETFSLPSEFNRPHTPWEEKLKYWQDDRNDTSALISVDQRQLCSEASSRLLAEIEEIGTENNYAVLLHF